MITDDKVIAIFRFPQNFLLIQKILIPLHLGNIE